MVNVSPSVSVRVVSVRVSANERNLLETAAEQARTSLSDFIRRKAVEAAEVAIAGRPVVVIAETDWEKFEAWVGGPARNVPPLRALAASRPVWRD